MSRWDNFLASIGIGSTEMTVVVDGDSHPRGSELTGHITLRGGAVPQHIERLSISVGYTQMIFVGKSFVPVYRELLQMTVMENINISPDETQTHPFAILMPEEAPSQIQLNVRADIAGGADPAVTLSLELTASREALLVQKALTGIGFAPRSPLQPVSIHPGRFASVHTPPENLYPYLDAVSLWLQRSSEGVEGALELNYAERSLADIAKSLLRLDRTQVPLSFSYQDLYDAEQKPRREHLESLLSAAIENTLILPDSEKQTLLRASDKPVTPEELLRPAKGGYSETHELLQPYENSQTAEHSQQEGEK